VVDVVAMSGKTNGAEKGDNIKRDGVVLGIGKAVLPREAGRYRMERLKGLKGVVREVRC
jgi:hypothetical protein